MEKNQYLNQTIGELVDQDTVRAYVLHYFGIRFYEYSEKTLEEVCRQKDLNAMEVVRQLEKAGHDLSTHDLALSTYPVDLIIEYLKHAHFLFVKHRLPYISGLLESIEQESGYFAPVRDLKILFPLFLEDFIGHIYEEEDTLFTYIIALDKAAKGKYPVSTLYQMMEKNALHRFAMEHAKHDDEMDGFRKITGNFHVYPATPLHVKVIFTELRSFGESLKIHARIENEILFPKAMALEERVRKLFKDKIILN